MGYGLSLRLRSEIDPFVRVPCSVATMLFVTVTISTIGVLKNAKAGISLRTDEDYGK